MSNELSLCGCSSACVSANEPIICTLAGPQQHEERIVEFRNVFVHLERTEPLDGAFRWQSATSRGSRRSFASWQDASASAAAFSTSAFQSNGGFIVWDVRAPVGAAGVLNELMRLPQMINALTAETMKQVFSEAGLNFRV